MKLVWSMAATAAVVSACGPVGFPHGGGSGGKPSDSGVPPVDGAGSGGRDAGAEPDASDAGESDGGQAILTWNGTDIGTVALGSVVNQTYEFMNSGEGSTKLTRIELPASDVASAFSLAGGTCRTGVTLGPGQQCTVVVRFSPTDVGYYLQPLVVSGSGGAETNLHLNASVEPALTLSDRPSFAFSGVSLGTSVSHTLTLTNVSSANQTLGSISDAGVGLAVPFALSGGSCATGLTLAPNATCTLAVTYAPTTAGFVRDSVDVPYYFLGGSSSGYRASRPVTGRGISDPNNCFEAGCPAQHVCKEITSSSTETGTCVFVPSPPENCMAPCLWEARKNCLPVMSECKSENLNIGLGVSVTCDLRSGWTDLSYYWLSGRWIDESQKDGQTCFESETGGYYFPGGSVFYSDGTSSIGRALGEEGSDRGVVCADGTEHQELNSAACTEWKSTYLDLTECRSTSAPAAGDCAATHTSF